MNISKIKALRNSWGGLDLYWYSSERRQCVRAVSDDLRERRSEVGCKGVTPYGK